MLRVTALSKIAFNSYLCLQLLISIATSRLPYFQMKSLFLQLFAIIVSPYYVILGLITISTESYYYTVTGLFNIRVSTVFIMYYNIYYCKRYSDLCTTCRRNTCKIMTSKN